MSSDNRGRGHRTMMTVQGHPAGRALSEVVHANQQSAIAARAAAAALQPRIPEVDVLIQGAVVTTDAERRAMLKGLADELAGALDAVPTAKDRLTQVKAALDRQTAEVAAIERESGTAEPPKDWIEAIVDGKPAPDMDHALRDDLERERDRAERLSIAQRKVELIRREIAVAEGAVRTAEAGVAAAERRLGDAMARTVYEELVNELLDVIQRRVQALRHLCVFTDDRSRMLRLTYSLGNDLFILPEGKSHGAGQAVRLVSLLMGGGFPYIGEADAEAARAALYALAGGIQGDTGDAA